MAKWGMAAKCRKFERVHAFDTDEEKMPISHLAAMGAVALACRRCPDFEQDPARIEKAERRCLHLLVSYMKIEEEKR